jgi:hypothetical protein
MISSDLRGAALSWLPACCGPVCLRGVVKTKMDPADTWPGDMGHACPGRVPIARCENRFTGRFVFHLLTPELPAST